MREGWGFGDRERGIKGGGGGEGTIREVQCV